METQFGQLDFSFWSLGRAAGTIQQAEIVEASSSSIGIVRLHLVVEGGS